MAKKFNAKKFRSMTHEHQIERFNQMLVDFDVARKSVEPKKTDILEAYNILVEEGIEIAGFTLVEGGKRVTINGQKAIEKIPAICELYRTAVTSDLVKVVDGVALSSFNKAIKPTGICVPTDMESKITDSKEIAASFKLSGDLKRAVDAKVQEELE